MEDVIANQVAFVGNLCTNAVNACAQQWASLSTKERMDVVEAVKSDADAHIDRLTNETSATRWTDTLDVYFNSLLALDVSPKLVVIELPAKKPVYTVVRKPGRKQVTRCFDDVHSDARAKATQVAELLYFKAVERYGHMNVEYIANTFSARASRRGRDAYGNPRTTFSKVRVVNAIRNLSLSSKLYAAVPAVCDEADLTVVFARSFPRKNRLSAITCSVDLYKIEWSAPSAEYKVRSYPVQKKSRHG